MQLGQPLQADIKFHGQKMVDNFHKFSNKMGDVWSTTAFIPNTKVTKIPAAVTSPDQYSNHCHHK